MKNARFADSHATSVREVEHWQQRGLCVGRPEEFDLDVIGDDATAIRAAVATCNRCPSIADRELFTLALPRLKRPQELVQAGRVWTDSKYLPRRLAKDEQAEASEDQMRADHAQYVRLKSTGMKVSRDLVLAERRYQRWRKRRKREREAAT